MNANCFTHPCDARVFRASRKCDERVQAFGSDDCGLR